jgi:hypothetical protein
MRVALALWVAAIAPTSLAAQDRPEPIRPEPIDVFGREVVRGEPSGQSGGDRDGSGGGRSGSSRGSSSAAGAQMVTVTLGAAVYTVKPAVATELQAFVSDYSKYQNAGTVMTAIASLLSVVGAISLNPSVPNFDVALKLQTADLNDLATALSAPSAWAINARSEAMLYCELNMIKAAGRPGGNQESRMWQAVRNILANPDKYQGGMKFSPNTRQLNLKPEAGARYRNGIGVNLSPSDVAVLRNLTNSMLGYGPARDFIVQSDFIIGLNSLNGPLVKLNGRDLLLLNYALLTVGPSTRAALNLQFSQLMYTLGMNSQMWALMRDFLVDEAWQDWVGEVAPIVGINGLEDELPEQSDVIG